MRKMSSRRGFTLPEVLVTVTIVAVLAAVMVPAVLNQVGKGDVPSVGGDIGAIRTAITTFAADTRRFPQFLSQLSGDVLLGTAKDFNGVAFGADAANYRGPYLTVAAGAHTGPTGGTFADTLVSTLPTPSNQICLRDDTTANAHSRVPAPVARQIDLAIDGVAGPTAGVVKFTIPSGDTLTGGTLRVCITSK
jgi:prepilin-type N-terminal cleavage/methylation domain